MPRILGLDLATRTGFAYDGIKGGVPIAGIFEAERPLGGKDKGGVQRGITALTFRRHVIHTINEARPDLVVYEAPLNVLLLQRSTSNRKKPFKTNMETVIMLAGFSFELEGLCYELQIDCRQVENRDFKKWFTGTTKGGKDPVKDRCRLLGWDFKNDDNAADACGIWAYAKMLRDPKWRPEQTTPLFGRPEVRL